MTSDTFAIYDTRMNYTNHTDKGLKNVSVEQCARIIGKSEQFVRVALQMGTATGKYEEMFGELPEA